MKKYLIVWLTVFCQVAFSLYGGLNLNDLIRMMNTEELVNSGLYKLTEEEKNAFHVWLQYKCPKYYAELPVEQSMTKISCYKSEPFIGLLANPDVYINESKLPWNLALCSCFQHDAKYLKEWIEYHKLVGVQHFYLYNNLSNDNYYEILKEYIERGEVELFEYPVSDYTVGQNYCYTDAVIRATGKARWLILADSDLFFVPLIENDLVSFLKPYENYGGVTVNLYNFGSNGVYTLAPGQLMIEHLFKREAALNHHVKTIVKPHRTVLVPNPHYALYKPGYYAVDENFRPIEGPYNYTYPCKKIQINHYLCRTKEFLYNVSVLRHMRFWAIIRGESLPLAINPEVQANFDAGDNLCSQVPDFAIYKYIPFLKDRVK
jgi:hypothetical protein